MSGVIATPYFQYTRLPAGRQPPVTKQLPAVLALTKLCRMCLYS